MSLRDLLTIVQLDTGLERSIVDDCVLKVGHYNSDHGDLW